MGNNNIWQANRARLWLFTTTLAPGRGDQEAPAPALTVQKVRPQKRKKKKSMDKKAADENMSPFRKIGPTLDRGCRKAMGSRPCRTHPAFQIVGILLANRAGMAMLTGRGIEHATAKGPRTGELYPQVIHNHDSCQTVTGGSIGQDKGGPS